MGIRKLVEGGEVSKLYCIGCSFYENQVYALNWNDVIDFLEGNIGFDYTITSIPLSNLPYGFYLLYEGECIEAEYDEIDGYICESDSNVYDKNGVKLEVGMIVRLKNRELCGADSSLLDNVFYEITNIYKGKVVVSCGYLESEVNGNDTVVVRNDEAFNSNEIKGGRRKKKISSNKTTAT